MGVKILLFFIDIAFFLSCGIFLHYTFLAAVMMMPFHRGINKGPTFNINLVNGRKQNAIKGGKLTPELHKLNFQSKTLQMSTIITQHVTNLLQNVQFY